MGIGYPISVTFVKVQLGSGGVLCVAQGTAQSHGKEDEDQRVSAHQLHLKCCNLFLFWLGHVQNGASKKAGQTTDSLFVLKSSFRHGKRAKASARMVVKNMGLLTASRTTTGRWMVWTPWRGSRAKQKKTKIQNTLALMRCILTLSNGQPRLQQIRRWHLQTKQHMELDGISQFPQVGKSMPGEP